MTTAVVLSGGGARGAFEAGVIAYLREELEPALGRRLPLSILCGTSVGALHACLLAATAHEPARQGELLTSFWRSLDLDRLLELRLRDAIALGRELVFAPKAGFAQRHVGLVQPRWLEEQLLRRIPWPWIGRNVRAGRVSVLSVTATHVGTGRPVVFVQGHQALPGWPVEAALYSVATRIGPKHALASAAIPLIFPPVTIGKRLYVDGGLRANVPLSPALRLGARRVLVLSVRHGDGRLPPLPDGEQRTYATAPFLIGKTLNALFLDPTEQDLSRLRQVNALLEAGTTAFGASFTDRLNQSRLPGTPPMRYVRELEIAPSRDIGALAADYARSATFAARNGGLAGRLIRQLAEREARYEADLASYLLFDGAFAAQLLELGRHDAAARREELVRFFSEEPQSSAEEAELRGG